ncbi:MULTISPECIES: class I SAM-dependent DNA methyltransferase [Halomonadaceae]|uniref:site-specific DNA-methyltransferase (adenine-specific) n=2 Tax=Vreelandella TaxID=3137766 RepID=A0A7Z0RYR0_9GAMM|nr:MULTISPECIES: class I SAM-dependent DNA methyltransferase [Halomonas]NYS78063.1 class I SAM-dependent DNA methyltransferase [Halomonas glaciei]|tara:strand:- start:12746 stop:15496 length:2751 start_codon:yes stop_codon:yes gene_type:complete
MNAIEIESAISDLAQQYFDPAEFPYAFLEAFGNKATTIKRLRSGTSNKSDFSGSWGGVLQTNNIHIAVAEAGAVTEALAELKASPATTRAKAKFVLATDGEMLEAEELESGETVACKYEEFPDHFGFFLPLAGITTVKQVRESSFDIRATSRLNRLYVELLKDNPSWGTEEQRHEMNHFMARLIFCFFAEDTDIFAGSGLFTDTVAEMSARDSANTHEVISEIFRAMNTRQEEHAAANTPRWAGKFPYVNGGLFSGSVDVPRFSKIARSYLLHIGSLDWTQINPDIFGSMIQAVADDEERGALGMHYTSVPNILKVLNPLFLNDLREKLEEANDNVRKLLNLRNRMAKIRVFDPACGSGNFLVIAYKQMRAIEAEINQRRGEPNRPTDIPLTNFRGIELRDFSAEVARLALIIAEYQCDLHYRGQKLALAEFLPLDSQNWITCDNALRLNWLSICPPTGTSVKHHADDLFGSPLDQAQIDFENEGGETYICGNPPYLGSKWQSSEQKADLKAIFESKGVAWKSLDYVAGWFMKAADYGKHTSAKTAFVSTNSICQGLQVPILWPTIFETGHQIVFAYTSFKWANLASHNACVTVAIIGISAKPQANKFLFSIGEDGLVQERQADYINPYLALGRVNSVVQARRPISEISPMLFGNMPRDGGAFVLNGEEKAAVLNQYPEISKFICPYLGSEQMIQGKPRWCIWIDDNNAEYAQQHPYLKTVLERVRDVRLASAASSTRDFAARPHRFVQIAGTAKKHSLAVAKVSSERRAYLPVDLLDGNSIVSDLLFALYDAPLWNMALIASRLHLVWVATVCGKMKTDFRYSNTIGWNTFPVPKLTEKNKDDLTKCAQEILLSRERHYPQTIAELYLLESMPDDLQLAHSLNDEVLERIYIGRRFKNDTERLERLFEMYSKMSG